MAQTTPQALTAALRYSPATQSKIRRSQYLTDALKQMQQDGPKITGGVGELAAKLAAVYLLNRGSERADLAAQEAVTGERTARNKGMIAALQGLGEPETPPLALQPAPPTVETVPPPAPVESKPLPPIAGVSAEDRLNLGRMVWGEARGEPRDGQIAAAAVALNRARERGVPLSEVISAPSQFNGFNPRSQALGEADLGPVLANIDPLLRGEIADPTGGADHFFNPSLANPGWAQGKPGQMIGQHRFLNLEGGPPAAAPQMAAQTLDQPAPIADQPFQVAAAGPLQPGMVPQGSAPASLPGVGMSPGPAQLPPAGPGGAPQPTYWRPTQRQIDLVTQLLESPDPVAQQQGEQMFYQMRQKMAEPIKYEATSVGGAPAFYDPANPTQLITPQIPGALQSRTVRAEDLGIPAPPGTILSVTPTGQISVVSRPESGHMVVGGPGQYREAPTPGGKNDPAAGQNLIANEGKLRDDYTAQMKPYVTAREGYQKVVEAARTATPAGDIALIFGYMKTLDPTSTVREGEYATVQNSGTVDQTVANLYNRLLTGKGSLSAEQRAEFAESARRQFQVYQHTADATTQRFSDLARSYGFAPERVVQAFAPIKPFAQPGPTSPAPGAPAGPANPLAGLSPAQLKAIEPYKGKRDVTGQPFRPGSKENPKLIVNQAQYDALGPSEWFIDTDGTLTQKGAR